MDNGEFITEVRAEMSEIGTKRGIPNEGDQFAVWFATEILKEELSKVVDDYHIGGSGDDKVDIGICDEDHEVRIVAQCKFTSKPLEKTFNKDLIDEVLAARNRLTTFPASGNTKRQEFAQLYNKSESPERSMAVGFGLFVTSAVEYAEANGVEVYDFEKLKKRYALLHAPGALRPPEYLEFSISKGKVVDKVEQQNSKEKYKLVTFLADAKKVSEYVDTFRDSLFQENLRYRLEGAAKSKIGDQIENTVTAKPELLEILNNGITIVARIVKDDDSIVKIYEPQIVNGGQTCWAIHDAIEDLRMKGRLDKVEPRVVIRAIQTGDADLVSSITKATNTQNAISERDKRSPDPCQQELATAFDRFTPSVLYEHREGLFGAIDRQGKSTLYRISGKTYRKLSNEFCGQLYLALMGLPNKSKAEKQKIMQDDDFYKTLYRYELPALERFGGVGLSPGTIQPRTGTSTIYVEDILFAFGVYSLAHAVGQLYNKKLDLFNTDEKRASDVFTNLLDYEFMKSWEYYVVAAVNHIVERMGQNGADRGLLRKSLVGTNINLYWQNLQGEFKLNESLGKYLILDEDKPSSNFPLFGKWAIQISYLMAKSVADLKEKKQWLSARNFLDLTDATYTDLVAKMEKILGGPSPQRNEVFPLQS